MWDPLTIQAAMGLTGFVVWLLWPLKHKLQRTVLMSPTDEGLDVASVVAAATGKQYLVIGTGGVGSKLIHTLIKRGETKIRAFDLRIPKECEPGRRHASRWHQAPEGFRGSHQLPLPVALGWHA